MVPPFPRFLLAVVGFAALAGAAGMASAQPPPSLGRAGSFAVLAGSAVTNTGATIVTGNLGVSPGDAINGFPPGTVKLGDIRNDLAQRAQRDAAAAYDDLDGRSCHPPSSQTLGPGVYCVSALTGTLTLDAAGDVNAVWIFQSSTLTAAADSSVRVIDGGYEGNVFWQASDSVTIGPRTAFAGNILARNAITFGNGASLSGRALAQTGAVTLDNNNVSLCCQPIALAPAALADGKVGTPYGPVTFTASGGTGSYELSAPPGSLPAGLSLSKAGVLSGTPAVVCEKTFTVTARDTATGCLGSRMYTIRVTCDLPITFSPAALPDGAVGAPYPPTKITPAGTPGPFALTVSGDLQRIGLSMSADGVVSGTPTSKGDFAFTVIATDTMSGCSGSQLYAIHVTCGPAITLSPPTLPTGTVSVPYNKTITASGGTVPYTFTVSGGTLPDGLTLTPNTPATTAVVSGTPTKPGPFAFTITATDAQGCFGSSSYTPQIDPSGCNTISLSPAAVPPATSGIPYNSAITAAGGAAPYVFNVSAGALPEGLALTPATPTTIDAISGTPSSSAISSKFTVRATDALSCFGEQAYTICLPSTIAPPALPNAVVGAPYSATFTASGGTSYQYTATGLPAGLSLDAKSGVLSGTVSTASAITFTVTATDDVTACAGSRTYTIVAVCPAIAIAPLVLPNGSVGTPYSQTITANGGAPPYTFVTAGPLPPGLTLSSAGALAGTPTTIGSTCFLVTVTDAAGCAGGPVAYTIVISAATCPAGTAIALSPATLPSAQTGAPYSQMITASGGTPPYTYSIISGALPPGLTLNPATGVVSGVPTSGGIFTLTIGAADANGCLGTMGCSIVMYVDIPAASGWGMGMLSLVMGAAGVLAMRRAGGS